MKFYDSSAEAVLNELKTSQNGLSSSEAAERLEKNGRNKLAEAKKDSLLKRFLSQINDPMLIMLIVAAVISAVTNFWEARGTGKIGVPWDTIIIMFVVIVNAVLGVVQESKAEQAIEALQKMSAAKSRVLRDGKEIVVESEELVVGDIVLLEAGDAVPADCRILESASIKAEEAALTGESVPVNKFIDVINLADGSEPTLADRKNMLYMGTTIVYGRGKAVVVATGMGTEMGKIADAITKAEEGLTPLQQKLDELSHKLSKLVIGICAFIMVFQVVYTGFVSGWSAIDFDFALDSFMVAVSLAVAAIPEGLVAVVTIVLSIGVTNMSKNNAIIRKMTAVETLGCAQVICSDKTGTLTQNVMTVVDRFCDNEQELAAAMALCSDAKLDPESGKAVGEPTEAALVNFAAKVGLKKDDIESKMPRVGEIPFDSSRKMMTTVHEQGGAGYIQFTKGAPDVIISRCATAELDGNVIPMTPEVAARIVKENKRMADNALRVLAVAKRKHSSLPEVYESDVLEKDLCFVGLEGMIDPVRPEVKDSIIECRSAGITPVMITGDHKDTAVAIAKELGIIEDASQAITGSELEAISDEEFAEKVKTTFVYARVQPEHKTRIVKAWQDNGNIAAMTGDGVNDAPSIKTADIGVGMGITGTDVTKNVADMVLTDDNFATIVSAIEEGRRVYDNIRKAIQFLLGSNLSEVLSIFFATLLRFTILLPTHLLFINLVTDCFPALALGVEKPEADIMKRKPRPASDGIFANGMWFDCLYQGILVTILTMAAYFIGVHDTLGQWQFTDIANNATGMTMAFFTLSMCEIFHSLNMRSQRGSVVAMTFKGSHNWLLFGSMVASLVLTTLIIEIEPIAKVFNFTNLDLKDYLISVALAFSIIPIVEIVKAIQRATAKSKKTA
ncbi:MAG: calcium-translocating P-type ATPase, PMCA-type [Clostridia bacterium]|nr:calcium-translocating P-type ATPase, PMCA-type [Clostridia bacterium]